MMNKISAIDKELLEKLAELEKRKVMENIKNEAWRE